MLTDIEEMPQVNTLGEAFKILKDTPSSMHEHMEYIHSCAAQASSVLEIGLNQGTSCVALLAGLKPGGQMVSVDLQGPLTPIRFILEWCAGEVRERKWMFLEADSLEALWRLRGMAFQFDLVFLDSSHQYEATKSELIQIAGMMMPGGKIL